MLVAAKRQPSTPTGLSGYFCNYITRTHVMGSVPLIILEADGKSHRRAFHVFAEFIAKYQAGACDDDPAGA